MFARILVAIVMIGSAMTAGAAIAQEKTKIVWGYINPSSFYWDVYAAMDLGFMAEESLEVEALNLPSAGQGAQLLLTSGVDVLSSNMEVAISAIEHGADIVFVGGELARATFALTVRPEIGDYAALKGKTLGVTQLTEASTTMLKLLLQKNGVAPGTYDLVTVGGTPNRLAALKTGAISATMLSQPADFQAQSLGMRVFGYAYEAFDGPVVSFTVQRSWARKNRDNLVRFLRASAKASRWLFDPNNRDRAVQILQRNAKIDAESALANYDLWFGSRAMMAKDLALTKAGVQAYLDLRGSKADAGTYLDMTYAQEALGK
jgi:NitT/TauT family transport system substrate-binding protein